MEDYARKRKVNLLELWYERLCPWCGKYIPEGSGVGTGRKAEGLFCDLTCYSRYYESELRERGAQDNLKSDPARI